jgi:uncharacterized protein YidB (DUF937 family)
MTLNVTGASGLKNDLGGAQTPGGLGSLMDTFSKPMNV